MNPVELSIFANRIEAVCDEMGAALQRAAFSPNIRDRLDYSCAVFDANGELCAQAAHIPVHLGSMAFAMRSIVEGIMRENELDAIVYPSSHTRPDLIDSPPNAGAAPGGGGSPVTLANMSGFPDMIVPAGFTGRGLPVTISFLGTAFSEPELLALGYAFEQLTKARRLPIHTPPLNGELISY